MSLWLWLCICDVLHHHWQGGVPRTTKNMPSVVIVSIAKIMNFGISRAASATQFRGRFPRLWWVIDDGSSSQVGRTGPHQLRGGPNIPMFHIDVWSAYDVKFPSRSGAWEPSSMWCILQTLQNSVKIWKHCRNCFFSFINSCCKNAKAELAICADLEKCW